MLADWFDNSDLFIAGGWVMVAILALSFLMWVLILERYLFFWRAEKHLAAATLRRWVAGRSSDPLVNRRLRAGLTSAFHGELSNWIGTIHVITAILPLLGLLGTVTGMIKTFDVMTAFGTGNVRGMADGISQALITTMAGLMTALAGMYFAGDLSQRIERETEQLSGHLIDQDGATYAATAEADA